MKDQESAFLKPLPGTAELGLWTGTNKFGRIDMKEVVFPLVEITSDNNCQVIGTAFFILRNGAFLTAGHVLGKDWSRLFGIHFTGAEEYVLRPIEAVYHHPTGDISLGVFSPMSSTKSGARLINNTLNVAVHRPIKGEPISTYSYPLHEVRQTSAGASLNLQPTFYSGKRGDYYDASGPSGKLNCPYYLADLHLYGASSGGPVFSRAGNVFAIASASYDGANDIAFLTPVRLGGDIVVPNADLEDGKGPQNYQLRDVVRAHFKTTEKSRRSGL